jgi:DNA-binding response OmpR family regulator
VKEFVVLEALLKRLNRPVSRQQLEAEVYGWNESIDSNSIEVHIHYLRRKIDPALIETVRGAGYQIGSLDKLGTGANHPADEQGHPRQASWLMGPLRR